MLGLDRRRVLAAGVSERFPTLTWFQPVMPRQWRVSPDPSPKSTSVLHRLLVVLS